MLDADTADAVMWSLVELYRWLKRGALDEEGLAYWRPVIDQIIVTCWQGDPELSAYVGRMIEAMEKPGGGNGWTVSG